MWEAWQLSNSYHCRPSELYGILHPVQQFYFDRAVWLFGKSVESDLEKAGGKATKPKQIEAARTRTLQKWLGTAALGVRPPPEVTRRA